MNTSFLLDTNVLSELMRSAPDPAVLAWFDNHANASMVTTAVTQAEIMSGIALLPEGSRRKRLAHAAQQMFAEDFHQRCLSFDAAAATHYALVLAQRTQAGRPITTEDGQIAAIALAAGLPLVTRNTKDFEAIEELHVINPWSQF